MFNINDIYKIYNNVKKEFVRAFGIEREIDIQIVRNIGSTPTLAVAGPSSEYPGKYVIVFFPEDDTYQLLPKGLKRIYLTETVIHETTHVYSSDYDLAQRIATDPTRFKRWNILEDMRVDFLADLVFPGHVKRIQTVVAHLFYKFVFKRHGNPIATQAYTPVYLYTGRSASPHIPHPEARRKLDVCRGN